MEAFCSPSPAPHPLTLDRLRNLTRINHRSAFRLRSAAVAAGDRVLRKRLEEFAAQRQAHADELNSRMRFDAAAAGDDDFNAPITSLTVLPVAEELPERIAMLTELERGESAACRAYARAIQRSMSGNDMQDVLNRQLAETERAHRIMRDLRDLMSED